MSEVVNVPASTLAAMQARLEQLEAQTSRQVEIRQAEQDAQLIASGRAADVVVRHRQAAVDAEQRARNFAADVALRTALEKHRLAGPAAADQVHSLLRGELVADPDPASGGYRPRTRDYRPVEALVQERLAQPAFAHFLAPDGPRPGTPTPTSPGPLAAPGTHQPVNSPLPLTAENLALAPPHMRAAAMQRAQAANGVSPSADMSQAFGLGRRR